MILTRIKHRLENIKSRTQDFIDLSKLAYETSKKINSKVIKYQLARELIDKTSSSASIVILGAFLNNLTSKNLEYSYLLLGGLFLIKVVSDLTTNYLAYRQNYHSYFIDVETSRLAINKIKEIPVRYRNEPNFIEIERNVDFHKVNNFFYDFIFLITNIYGAILVFATLSFFQFYILIFAISIALISIYLESSSRIQLFKRRKEQSYYVNLNYSLLANFKVRDLSNLRDNIKINNNSKFLEHIYFDLFFGHYKNWFNQFSKNVEGKKLLSSNILDIGTAVSLVVVYMYGVLGMIQVGSLVIFAQAYQNLLNSLRNLSTVFAKLFENYLAVKALSELFNYEIPKIEYKKIENLNNLEIEFKNVSFTYPGTNKKILKNISFKISNHDKLGIIGENGAGKSTLIKLLFRIYTPTSGSILLNGVEINDISDDDFYNLFSLLSQTTEVENSMTIEDIIYLGDSSKSKNIKRIIQAAKKASLHHDILKLEDGYKQLITTQNQVAINNKYSEKKYTSLSGGQYRKLLLAKLFYSQKPIYVLDEPTDSIDPNSAYKIFKNLNDIPHKQILILITHDVQRLQLASNKILVLKEGEIIEFGETEKLLKNKNSQLSQSLNTYQKTIKK